MVSPENLPNVGLLIAGIFGIWVANRTLTAIRVQTEVATLAAQAARDSADALINSERALLVTELVPDAVQREDGTWVKNDSFRVPLSRDEIIIGAFYQYKVKITNIGKTPAQVLGLEKRYSCLRKGITELPAHSANAISKEAMELILRAGQAEILSEFNIREFITPAREEIDSLEKTAVFNGWVRYLAVIDVRKEHFADYCYVYEASRKRLVVRNIYNTQKHQDSN